MPEVSIFEPLTYQHADNKVVWLQRYRLELLIAVMSVYYKRHPDNGEIRSILKGLQELKDYMLENPFAALRQSTMLALNNYWKEYHV